MNPSSRPVSGLPLVPDQKFVQEVMPGSARARFGVDVMSGRPDSRDLSTNATLHEKRNHQPTPPI